MALSQDLISQFAKITSKEEKQKEVTVKGTYKTIDGEEFVQIDGSDIWTPVISTVEAADGERVTVSIKDHTATITGNISSPSARTKTVQNLKDEVDEYGNTIKQLDNTITQQGNSIIQIDNSIKQVENTINQHDNTINQQGNAIQQIDNTIKQQGDTITSMNNTIVQQGNEITEINNTVESQGNVISQHDNIIEQHDNKITQQGNTIEAYGNDILLFDSQIKILNSGFVIENGVLKGLSEIIVQELETDTLNAKYANIDFTNINYAAVQKIFTESGIIKDLIVSEGKITGELVGVTIKGDLIEGNTVKADKLVVKGEDGLYYKLNVDSLGETTASSDEKYQNGLDGSIIIAESITAEKIQVDDLVAFGATIGGFNIGKDSIYSGVKESVHNTTKGIYMDKNGQFAIGDSNDFIKYFLDEKTNAYKLEISAGAITKHVYSKTETDNKIKEDINNLTIGGRNYFRPLNIVDLGCAASGLTSTGSCKSFYASTTPGEIWSLSRSNTSNNRFDYCFTVEEPDEGVPITNWDQSHRNDLKIEGIVVPDGVNYIFVYLSNQNDELPDIKLEKGNKATDWSPAPEDITDDVNYVKNELEGIGSTETLEVDGEEIITVDASDNPMDLYVYGKTEQEISENSPSPEYPSEIKNLTNSINLTVCNENLCKVSSDNVLIYSGYDKFTIENDVVTCTGNSLFGFKVKVKPNTTYTRINLIDGYTTGNAMFRIREHLKEPFAYFNDENFILQTQMSFSKNGLLSHEFTTTENTNWLLVSCYIETTTPVTISEWGLYEGKHSDEYIKHESQHFVFPLSEGQKLYKDSYLADDGVHHKRSQYQFTGNETLLTDLELTNTRRYYNNTKVVNAKGLLAVSNRFIQADSATDLNNNDNEKIITLNGGQFAFRINKTTANGVTAVKQWLSENLLIVEYELAEELIEPYTEEQKTILDNIKTFKGINHIYCDDEIKPEKIVLSYYPNTLYNDTLVNKDTFDNTQTNMMNNVNDRFNEVDISISTAHSTIKQLSDMISHLITDANGGSLMTQTEDGWTFNMSSITGNLTAIQEAMENMSDEHNESNSALEKLTNLVNDVTNKTAYITMATDENGDPCIELGKSDNVFKVRITNQAIDFLEGSTKIAYANNNTFYAEKMIVKNELQIGEGPGFVWRTRANGNMGLVYITG